MIHFASVNLKNWVAGYLCSLKIKYLCPGSSEIVDLKTEQNKKKEKKNLFILVLCQWHTWTIQQEEHQATTLPGEQQWSGGWCAGLEPSGCQLEKTQHTLSEKYSRRGPSGHFIIHINI